MLQLKVTKKECGKTIWLFQREMTLILLFWDQCHQIMHNLFFVSCHLHFLGFFFFSVVCSLPFTEQVANNRFMWIWSHSFRPVFFGFEWQIMPNSPEEPISHQFPRQTISTRAINCIPGHILCLALWPKLLNKGGDMDSRVPWEISYTGKSLAFVGQEVYYLPLKKQNS